MSGKWVNRFRTLDSGGVTLFKTLAECQTHATKRAAETGLTVAIEERYPDGWWVIDTAEPQSGPVLDTVWVAEFDSRHFSFLAVGKTKAEARAAMIRTLEVYGQQYGDPGWFREYVDDMNIHEVIVGGLGLADYHQVTERGE